MAFSSVSVFSSSESPAMRTCVSSSFSRRSSSELEGAAVEYRFSSISNTIASETGLSVTSTPYSSRSSSHLLLDQSLISDSFSTILSRSSLITPRVRRSPSVSSSGSRLYSSRSFCRSWKICSPSSSASWKRSGSVSSLMLTSSFPVIRLWRSCSFSSRMSVLTNQGSSS